MTHGRPVTFGRYVFWGIVSILVAAFLAWSFVPAAVPVDTSVLERGPMVVNVEGEGRTRVKDVYVISAPVAGRLMRIQAEAGDPVSATETQLAVIEPVDPSILDQRSRAEAEATAQAAEDALSLASAEVERARAELRFAETELKRAQQLSAKGTVSQRTLDKAERDLATRAAELKSALATEQVRQHELETARARLITPTGTRGDAHCCVAITSPIDGRVLRVLQESEGVVAAGQDLLEVGNPGQMEVVVDLLTSDAARIQEGAEVVIENWGGPDLQGAVRRIEPFGYTKLSVLGIEEQRVDVVIDFAEPDAIPAALGHGFRVEVAIEEWRADDVLKAPMAALFRDQGRWAVFVLNDKVAELRTIEVGHLNGREAEVLSGLEPGEEVVLHPSDRISDGVKLARREPG